MKDDRKELEKRLEEDYDRWYELFVNGGSDPSYTDGTNLELVRNHIIWDKRQIIKELSPEEYPTDIYRRLPPVVPRCYMAHSKDIRERAKETYRAVTSRAEWEWLERHYCDFNFSKYLINRGKLEVTRIHSIPKALEDDELVFLRVVGNPQREVRDLINIRERYKKEQESTGEKEETGTEQKQDEEKSYVQLSFFD